MNLPLMGLTSVTLVTVAEKVTPRPSRLKRIFSLTGTAEKTQVWTRFCSVFFRLWFARGLTASGMGQWSQHLQNGV
ncbi:hypothetical protein BJX76DRAFT_330707 [Aspergillus varians]